MSSTGTTSGSDRRIYSRPPIVEAVVEVKAALAPGITLESLKALGDSEKDRYPSRQVRTEVQGEIRIEDGVATTQAEQAETGYVFLAADGARQFHARLDGFAYMQRAPYTDWDDLSVELQRLWQSYVAVAKPQMISRIGVRFINRVDIPLGSVELKDYFRTTAEVSPALPQVISGLFVQVQLPVITDGIGANIISTLVPAPRPAFTSVLLDIDVFAQPGLLVQNAGFDKQFADILARLRTAKNEVFEACITDATRELIS